MAYGDSVISESVFKAIIGLLLSIAIVSVCAKAAFQIRTQKALRPEDILLLCACVCLSAGTGLLYKLAEALYSPDNCGLVPRPLRLSAEAVSRVTAAQQNQFSFLVLTYVAIFCVKFGFLLFFKQLVNRIWQMLLFWKIVVVFTSISFLVCISEPFFACPNFGVDIVKCTAPERLALMKRLDVLPIVMDILVDVLIVIIPIYILWKVRIKTHQKLGLGAFLSLNTLMSFVACVRVTGLGVDQPYDVIWADFWLQIEACVGILMVSITAFRTIFVINATKANQERVARPWYSSTVERLRGRRQPNLGDPEVGRLPTIPPAAMTSIRTFNAGGKDVTEGCDGMFSYERRVQEFVSEKSSSIHSDLRMV